MSIIQQCSRNCEILKTSTWQPQWSRDHHLTCVVDLGECVRYHVAFIHFNHYFTVVIDVKIWIEIAAWVVWVNGIACQRSTRRLTDVLVVNGALITSRYWMLLKSSQITMATDISIQYLLSSLQFHFLKIYFKINISTNSRQQNPSWEAKSNSASQEIPHLPWLWRFITVFTKDYYLNFKHIIQFFYCLSAMKRCIMLGSN